MSTQERPPVRFEHAVAALPDLPDLRLIREALVDASRVEQAQAWSGGARLATLDKRVVDLGEVESRVREMAERVRERTERVLGEAARALRALERRDEAAACRHLVAAGEVEESHHRLVEAERYYEKAAELGKRPRDRSGEALALRRLGRVARSRGNLERALHMYRTSWEIASAEDDAEATAIGALGVGHVLSDQGRWAEARDWYRTGMESAAAASRELIHLCNALSVVERRLGDLEASRGWLERGEASAAEVDDAGAVAYLRHGRGMFHLAAGELEQAEAVFRDALAHPLDAAGRVVASVNLAETLRLNGRVDDAEETAREAEALAISMGDLVHLPHVYLELGQVAAARGDAEGFVFFEQALDMLTARGSPPLEVAAVQRSYGLFEARFGRHELAAARLREARDLYTGIGSSAEAELVERQIAELADADLTINMTNDVEL